MRYQRGRESRKLESLPEDLRSVADALIKQKFPEPEVVEKPPMPSGRTVQFPFRDPDTSIFDNPNWATTITPYKTRATKSTIDQQSLERILYGYRGMDGRHHLTLMFRVSPIGEFPSHGDNYHLLQQLRNERIELQITGDQIHLVQSHVEHRLKALEALYQGYFHCMLDKVDVRVLDPWTRNYQP